LENDSVIKRIDECLRKDPSLRDEGPARAELLQICVRNSHLTGTQLFDQFRGHLNVVTLQRLISTWDTWRGVLSTTLLVTPVNGSAARAAAPRSR
jgi:hypothetical protein